MIFFYQRTRRKLFVSQCCKDIIIIIARFDFNLKAARELAYSDIRYTVHLIFSYLFSVCLDLIECP